MTAVVPPTGYAVTDHNCTTIAATGTCHVTLTFTPGTQGTVAGPLAVTYAGGGPTVVSLTGVGERSLGRGRHFGLARFRR